MTTLKVSLISMPFATLKYPSIALTQLKAAAEKRLGDRVRVRILYLHHEVANELGLVTYEMMNSLRASNVGVGDWLFRSLAFPHLPDNADAYFQRFFPYRDPGLEAQRRLILEKRARLGGLLERLIDKYELAAEDLVGLTSTFSQNVSSLALARMVKERNPAVTTLMGGANCEAPMGQELARYVPALDFVFSGPGLVSFPDLLQRRLDEDLDGCHQIRGVFSRKNVEEERHQGHGAIGEDLPITVPLPLDYDSFLKDLSAHFPGGEVQPCLIFETSRGCWWGERAHCTFCGLNGGTMAFRSMPAAQALQLFDDLFARYGEICSDFESVDNIMPREYLSEVFPYVRPPAGASLFYEVKADLKGHEMKVLGESGVTRIQPGIESLASSTLKLMHKGITAFQNINFLKNSLRYGLNPSWNLLIGFPGEGEEVYRKYMADVPLLSHLPPASGAFPVRFDRYSPYFTRAAEYGLRLSPYDFYRYVYPFPEESLANLAYYFEDRNYAAKYLAEMAVWKERLGRVCVHWNARWSGSDGGLRASLTLHLRDSGGVIRDTRDGRLVEHAVDELEVRALAFIDGNGWRVRDIARHVGAEEARVEEIIERFRRSGLLFEEGERVLSLVLAPARTVQEKVPVAANRSNLTAIESPAVEPRL